MKPFPLILAIALALATPQAMAQTTYYWDVSTNSGTQNGNGTWGVDNFWSTNGTTLLPWSPGRDAWLGGNGTVAGTPGGNFTITVSGTQQANTIRQIQNGAGNFTLTGGELEVLGFRVDTNTLTINSKILDAQTNANNWMSFTAIISTSTLIIGGDNTFTNIARIGGNAGGGGKILLNHQNALGLGNEVLFANGANLDLNGYSISNKTIRVTDTRTGVMVNSGTNNAVWSGNVVLTNTNSVGFRAGGTNGFAVEVSGVISGTTNNSVQSQDGGRLRLSGANTYDGDTSVRTSSTLIVGNTSALGSTTRGTFVNTGGTLDLNGFNVGNEAITLQTASSRLVNNNASSAANVDGNIELQTSGYLVREIGGAGNLTLGGVISGNNAGAGFTKVGTGTVTLSGNNTYTGQTAVSAGSLIINGSQSTGVLNVSSGATLGGSGTIGGATTISGVLAPGNSIGTLTVANDVTWNGGENWVFELGAAGPSIGSPGTSDLLAITGGNDFLKGTVASFTFDFAGTGDFGWYKLVDWAGGSTTFDVLDFAGVNLGGVYTSEFAIQDNALYVNVVPEPSTYALLLLAAIGLGAHVVRRRRSA